MSDRFMSNKGVWLSGTDDVIKRTEAEIRKLALASNGAMWRACFEVANQAKIWTPVGETSHLINSQYVEVEPTLSGPIGTIGYTAAYAPYVHEMVNATFQKAGATAKFLENAFKAKAARVMEILGQDVKFDVKVGTRETREVQP